MNITCLSFRSSACGTSPTRYQRGTGWCGRRPTPGDQSDAALSVIVRERLVITTSSLHPAIRCSILQNPQQWNLSFLPLRVRNSTNRKINQPFPTSNQNLTWRVLFSRPHYIFCLVYCIAAYTSKQGSADWLFYLQMLLPSYPWQFLTHNESSAIFLQSSYRSVH